MVYTPATADTVGAPASSRSYAAGGHHDPGAAVGPGAYLAMLWRRRWVILGTTLLAALVAGLGASHAVPDKYRAAATLRVAPVNGTLDRFNYDLQYADRLMNTYRSLVASESVQRELAQRVGSSRLLETGVEMVANTELMRVTAAATEPAVAALAANSLSGILLDRVRQQSSAPELNAEIARFQSELTEARRAYETTAADAAASSAKLADAKRVVELKEETVATLLRQQERNRVADVVRASALSVIAPAEPPTSPATPRLELLVLAGAAAGLLGGIALAVLFEGLDSTLRDVRQVRELAGLPVLTTVPRRRRWRRIRLDEPGPDDEAFRRLRANLFTPDRGRSVRSLLFTSAGPREGRSTIASNLARLVAEAGRSVVLVDADLRRPSLHKGFDLPNLVGLAHVLNGSATLAEALQTTKVQGLDLLTSGALPHRPAELLASDQMQRLVGELTERYDLVIFDAPSLLAVSDAAPLTQLVDAVVPVVSLRHTSRGDLVALREQLAELSIEPLGVVVNRATRDRRSHYYAPQPRPPRPSGPSSGDEWHPRDALPALTPADGTIHYALKRCADVLLATALLLVALPVMVVIVLWIVLDSPGGPFFVQERVGARRLRWCGQTYWVPRLFRLYKFRSMRNDSDASLHRAYVQAFVRGELAPGGPGVFKLTSDPRVTRVGHFLRRFSLDELPQLFNVIRGDMSLVGPRPVPPYEVAEYQPHHRARLAALPGITGLWQVTGRCQVAFEDMVRLDLEYVRHKSLFLDLKILLMTVPAVLGARGAH